MRVLHVTPLHFGESGYFGGGERYVYNLVKSLNKFERHFIQAKIACFHTSGATPSSVDDSHIPITFLPDDAGAGPFSSSSKKLWGAIRDADIVHVHQPLSMTGTIAVLAAKQCQKPVAITDTGFDNTNSLLTRWGGMTLVDRIICISEFSASFFRLFAKHSVIDVVRGPVDIEQFRSSNDSTKKKHQILCVARILPHKAIDLVIKALPSDLSLIVCGHIYHSDYYQHLKSLATRKMVHFIVDAADKQLEELYSSSLATILASQYVDCYGNHYNKPELMGLTLLESMSAGTPVVCARVGAMPELVTGSETGLTFGDPRELSTILERINKGNWPAAGASTACVNHVRENFSLPVVARKLRYIYSEMLKHDL